MAERRFSALFAMRPGVLAEAFPPELAARLRRAVDLVREAPVTDFADPALGRDLGRVEIIISSWGCPPIDEALLDAAPKLCAVIHAAGTVKGHVSPLAWKRGVLVSSAATVNAEPVAQYTLAVILLAGKQAFHLARRYADGGDPAELRAGADLGNHRRTIGVIGASKIGRLVLPLLEANGFDVLLSDPTLDTGQAARLTPGGRTRLVDLDTLMADSDVVSVHTPLLPSTVGLIDDRRLSLLRDGATLVNTARGAIVDTEALTRHCASGRISAVLDVTEPEPLPAGHPLLHLPNVLVTPHVAGALGTEVVRLGEHAVAEAERLAAGRPMTGLVHLDELELIA